MPANHRCAQVRPVSGQHPSCAGRRSRCRRAWSDRYRSSPAARAWLDVVGAQATAQARVNWTMPPCSPRRREQTGAEDRNIIEPTIDDLAEPAAFIAEIDRLRAQEGLVRLVWITLFHSAMSSGAGLFDIDPAFDEMSIRRARRRRGRPCGDRVLVVTSPRSRSPCAACLTPRPLPPTWPRCGPHRDRRAASQPAGMPSPMPPLPAVTMLPCR